MNQSEYFEYDENAESGDEAVETIHQPAMAGNDVAGVFNAKTPLHRRLEEIAELRND